MLANSKDPNSKHPDSDQEDDKSDPASSSSDARPRGKINIHRSIAKKREKTLWTDAVEKKDQKPLSSNSESITQTPIQNNSISKSGSSSSARIYTHTKTNNKGEQLESIKEADEGSPSEQNFRHEAR